MELFVLFYHHAKEGFAGSFLFSFASPNYKLGHCSESWTNFPTDLPSETDKVWTINLLKTKEEIRVVVHCNDKEVLNVVLSDTECEDSSWSTTWSKDVEKIKFQGNASDYYRSGKFLVSLTFS